MLGLPLRNLLKPGSYPVKPEEIQVQPEILQQKIVTTQKDTVVNQLTQEVDILTEIAELQLKLVDKMGKKASTEMLEDLKISKDSVIKSIKDEIYNKKSNKGQILSNNGNMHLMQDLKNGKSVEIEKDLRQFLGLNESVNPLVVFDLRGHHEFRQTVINSSQRLRELKSLEPTLKESAKSNTEKIRKKMIQDGDKLLQKRKAEIETYKLKVVELKLWKRKWQTRQRSLEQKKRKRKEKMEKRRIWINDQIKKGFMHKSCKVLVHSRAKFPFEIGFEKRKGKKSSEDNLASQIRGVHIGPNGLVYPYKKKMEETKKKQKKLEFETNPNSILLEQPQTTVFTLTDDVLQPVQEVHYIHEPFMESVTVDENGTPAVIHYIQLDTTENF